MSTVTRKSMFILLGIGGMEAVPYVMVLRLSSHAGVVRLYAFEPAIWPAWIAAGIVTAAYVLHAVHALPLVRAHFFDPHPLKLLAIPFALITGTMEELWFRRMLMDWAAHHGAPGAVQVLASALAFGIAHGIWGLFGRQWRVAVGACVATGLLGALLASIYLLGGRQLAPCVWAHILINLAIEPWLIMSAVSAGADWQRVPDATPA